MQNAKKSSIAWDLGISDFIEEVPPSAETMNTRVYPFIHKDKKIFMVRPDPSWKPESEA